VRIVVVVVAVGLSVVVRSVFVVVDRFDVVVDVRSVICCSIRCWYCSIRQTVVVLHVRSLLLLVWYADSLAGCCWFAGFC
jgi:uncharacterized Fe-S cluster-containing radical SAM superfamily enzyme